MISKIAAASCIAALLSAPAWAQATQGQIDPQAYAGLWYEIERTPAPFQEQCEGGVTALYEQIDAQTVRVLNRCDLPGEDVSSVEGLAEEVGDNFRRFEVSFDGAPEGEEANYVVEAVGPVEDGRYAWAAVSDGDGGIGWILAPLPELAEDMRREARAALEKAAAAPERDAPAAAEL
jgi:apolipoprotein D and lipocalin family protein